MYLYFTSAILLKLLFQIISAVYSNTTWRRCRGRNGEMLCNPNAPDSDLKQRIEGIPLRRSKWHQKLGKKKEKKWKKANASAWWYCTPSLVPSQLVISRFCFASHILKSTCPSVASLVNCWWGEGAFVATRVIQIKSKFSLLNSAGNKMPPLLLRQILLILPQDGLWLLC